MVRYCVLCFGEYKNAWFLTSRNVEYISGNKTSPNKQNPSERIRATDVSYVEGS